MAEETQEELMERVKKMSPEELQEFQKSRCIFCHIVAGKVPSKKIYDDDKVIAVLDINPANKGHVLLMPKEHHAIMPQIPQNILAHLFVVAKKLSQVALKALGAKGTNIVIQNGVAAGQKAQHFMIHIIPRYEKDEVKLNLERKTVSESDYDIIRTRLRKRVNEIFGIKEEEKGEAEKAYQVQDAEIVDEVKNIKDANEQIEETNKDIEELKEVVEKPKKNKLPKKKRSSEKNNPQEKTKNSGVDLDDIANLLGGK